LFTTNYHDKPGLCIRNDVQLSQMVGFRDVWSLFTTPSWGVNLQAIHCIHSLSEKICPNVDFMCAGVCVHDVQDDFDCDEGSKCHSSQL
jgi:hypothetical protein